MSVRDEYVVITNQDGSREEASVIRKRVCNGCVWYLLKTAKGEEWRREDVVRESGRPLVSEYQSKI